MTDHAVAERTCEECGADISHRIRSAKTCSDLCRKRRANGGTCEACGARTSHGGAGPGRFCFGCSKLQPNAGREKMERRAMEKYLQLEELWHEGYTVREIAEALGTTPNTVGVLFANLRKRPDFDLPYRYRGYGKN